MLWIGRTLTTARTIDPGGMFWHASLSLGTTWLKATTSGVECGSSECGGPRVDFGVWWPPSFWLFWGQGPYLCDLPESIYIYITLILLSYHYIIYISMVRSRKLTLRRLVIAVFWPSPLAVSARICNFHHPYLLGVGLPPPLKSFLKWFWGGLERSPLKIISPT